MDNNQITPGIFPQYPQANKDNNPVVAPTQDTTPAQSPTPAFQTYQSAQPPSQQPQPQPQPQFQSQQPPKKEEGRGYLWYGFFSCLLYFIIGSMIFAFITDQFISSRLYDSQWIILNPAIIYLGVPILVFLFTNIGNRSIKTKKFGRGFVLFPIIAGIVGFGACMFMFFGRF